MCKQGLLVDPTRIALILCLSPSTNVKMLRVMLVHTGYYHKFIKGYAAKIAPMENLLKKDVAFDLNQECQGSLTH